MAVQPVPTHLHKPSSTLRDPRLAVELVAALAADQGMPDHA